MIIRQIQESDAQQLLELQLQLDEETQFMLFEPGERKRTREEQLRFVQQYLNEERSMIFVAEHEGKLVGYLSARGAPLQRIRHTVYIVVGILQAFTRQGVGTQLFSALEAWAREKQLHRLELSVMVNNELAITLYQKRGFEIEGRRRDAVVVNGNYLDEYYMTKLLS